jgi:hypothetical protein
VLASYRILRTHSVARVVSVLISFAVPIAHLSAGGQRLLRPQIGLAIAQLPRHLVVQFTARTTRVRTGSETVFFAKIEGPGRLQATSLTYGDGSRPADNSGQISCATGGGMQIVETITYQHRYLRPGTYRATFVVKTEALSAPCKQTTTTRFVTINVRDT